MIVRYLHKIVFLEKMHQLINGKDHTIYLGYLAIGVTPPVRW